jgi:uncharacterized protein (DUF2267 family)
VGALRYYEIPILNVKTKGEPPVRSDSSSVAVVGVPARRRRRARTRPRRIWRFSAAHVIWSGILRILQRVVHHKKTDRREFKINFSVRDVLAESSRAVRAQFDALVQAVQKAGKYPAKEEAARAVHAVMDALKDKVPPDVLSRMADSLRLSEAVRRLHPEGKNEQESMTAAQSQPATGQSAMESKPADK